MKLYGITTSSAHLWAHACPGDGSFYMYSRKRMVARLGRYETRQIASARGHLVPIRSNLTDNGGFIRQYGPHFRLFDLWDWGAAENDDAVGGMAEAAFEEACARNLIRLPVRARRYETTEDQFQGKDFACRLVCAVIDVEVKADIRGGVWGSGNLFVQTHEWKHQHQDRNAHLRLV